MKKQIIKITEKDLHNMLKFALKEFISYGDEQSEGEEEITPYTQYINDYPNEEFKKENIEITDLLNFIKNYGDFLYYYNGKFHAANSNEIVKEIYQEIKTNGAYLTDNLDEILEYKWDKLFGTNVEHIAVFETKDKQGTTYYVVYED